MGNRYKQVVDERFLQDLRDIIAQLSPEDRGFFKDQVVNEMYELDSNWEKISRDTEYPPLSTYDYKKRYLHSIPVHIKQARGWEDLSSDYRIVFKVHEDTNELYFYAIGKRIKGLPKDPKDIWALIKGRDLPEEVDS